MKTRAVLLGCALAVASLESTTLALGVPAGDPADATVLVPHSVLDSKVVRIALLQAADWVSAGRYVDACMALQDILERYPNHVVNLGGGLYRGAHAYAVELLLSLPSEALTAYRAKYDAEARAAFQRALEDRDPSRLQAMLLRFAATSFGDDALDALAAVHLERGDAAEALYYLDEIARRHPGSEFDSSLRLAKVGWCHAALGDTAALEADRETARRRFPDAVVRVGGVETRLADYLEERARRAAAAPVRAASPSGWDRLGGNNANSRLQSPVPAGLEKQWHARLDFEVPREAPFESMGLPETAPDEILAPYHPAVFGGSVILHNGLWVEALNLYNGKRRWTFHTSKDESTAEQPDARQSYAATIAEGIAYVSLEVPVDTVPRRYRFTPIVVPIPERKLFALDAETGAVVWRHDKFESASREQEAFLRKASIPTAPIVRRDLLIAGASYFEGKVHSYLCGFDRLTGQLRWKTLICTGQQELNMFGQPFREHVTSPLAEEDGVVYFSANLGYVAAVDARTGLIRWITEYPQVPLPVTRNYQPQARELEWLNNPPILTPSLLYVAPLDSRDLLAIERNTGAIRWRAPRPKGVREARYVLGLTRSSVVLAGQGLFFVDRDTGQQRLPAVPFSHPREFAVGRGAITPSSILCPTDSGLYAFDPESGRSIGEPRRWAGPDEGGNVVSVDGFLVVVSNKQASVHYQWDELFVRLQRDVERRPDDPEPRLRLADAYEQANKLDVAAEAYRQVAELASARGGPESDSVRLAARRGLFQVHDQLAHRALLAGDWERAARFLGEASRFAYDDETRIRSLLAFERYHRSRRDAAGLDLTFRSMLEQASEASFDFYSDHAPIPAGLYACLSLGEFHQQERRPTEAVQAYQDIVRRYPHVRFRGAEAGEFAKQQIDILVAAAGPVVYAAFEREARELFTEARARKDEATLRRILDEYPNSSVTEECLIDLARLLKQSGRRGEAVKALRSFLQSFPHSRLRPEVIADVGAAYEGAGLLESAARVLRYLIDQHPSEFLSVEGRRTGVDTFARERLERLPSEWADAPTGELAAGSVAELWRRAYPGTSNLTIAQITGGWSPFFDEHLFFISNRTLCCVRRFDGELRWSLKSLADIPKDRLVHQDGILVTSTVREVVAVQVETGDELWRASTDGYVKSVAAGPATLVLSLEVPGVAGAASSHVLRGLDLLTGGTVWERVLQGRVSGEPGMADKLVWAVTTTATPGRANVTVLDAFTGRTYWEVDSLKDPSVSPFSAEAVAIAETGLVLFSGHNQSNSLRLYDLARRELRWEASLRGFIFRRMLKVGDDIALFLRPAPTRETANRPSMYLVQLRSGATGELLFQQELPGDGMINPAEMAEIPGQRGLRPDTIYFYRNDRDRRVLIGIDSTTGAIRFERTLERGQPFLKRLHAAGPTVVCEMIVQTDVEPRLVVVLLDASTGEPRQPDLSFDLSGTFTSDLAIVGGALCVATGNRLYCYGQ
jgi:outer membrane protein assembly factor BamB/thioredoxin-like negative regulator of GroEL